VKPPGSLKELAVTFMLTFTFDPATRARDEAIARFKKTGGMPPAGAKLLGRWTAADFSGGFVLVESSDASALTEFSLMWSDILDLRVVPVVEDQQLSEVLQKVA
jgi:hypothetical protein